MVEYLGHRSYGSYFLNAHKDVICIIMGCEPYELNLYISLIQYLYRYQNLGKIGLFDTSHEVWDSTSFELRQKWV